MEYLRDEGEFMCEKERKKDSFVCEWVNEGMKVLQRMIERKWKEKKKRKIIGLLIVGFIHA